MEKTVNVKIAGLGGQGVIRASDILAETAFRAGLAVKKSELHGMSQRGGSVSSDVRFGREVLSPMIPAGESDYLVVVSSDQVENNLPSLKPGGVLIRPEMIDENALTNKKSLNVALLGALSTRLELPEALWLETIREAFKPELFEANANAFRLGRSAKE
ncbi:MAG: 2-oxoacid:acceptor oxidoreductase family protein [Anaerolineales bacterium]|nr:2-oxoacid:acceptor oxidoreductase family protein [Anaerolineales bacterium]